MTRHSFYFPGVLSPPRFGSPLALRRFLYGPAMVVLAIFMLAAGLGGCLVTEQELSVDEGKKRRVVILSGTGEPDAPPSPKFQNLTRAQVDRSLRRMTVEVSRYVSFNTDDPEPFLSNQQIDWAIQPILTHVPKLKPDQRLLLEFRDKFHKYQVAVEIFSEGSNLVFYFTKLSMSEDAERTARPGARANDWVSFVVQPGQELDWFPEATILKDKVYGEGPIADPDRDAKLDLIAAAMDKKIIDEDEGRELAKVVDQSPEFLLSIYKSHFEKLETLKKALEQNLFTEEEHDTRVEQLRKLLIP